MSSQFDFNHFFILAFSPLLGAAVEGLDSLRDSDLSVIEKFTVYFNPYGVLFNGGASDEFIQSVQDGSFSFTRDEIEKLIQVSRYPAAKDVPIFQGQEEPERPFLPAESNDLDRKFMYTLMLAAAGRLSNKPNPPLSFYDKKVLLYYDLEPLTNLTKGEEEEQVNLSPSIGQFESFLYVRRQNKGSGPKWNILFARCPPWSLRDNSTQLLDAWSSFDESDQVSKEEVDRILTRRFKRTKDSSLKVWSRVNLDMDSYGKALRFYHLLGNIFEMSGYPSRDNQWAYIVTQFDSLRVPFYNVDGQSLTAILLYFIRTTSQTDLRALPTYGSPVRARPVEMTYTNLQNLVVTADNAPPIASEQAKTSINTLEPGRILDYISDNSLGGTRKLLADVQPETASTYWSRVKSAVIAEKRPFLTAPVSGVENATKVTWEQKKTYVSWLCSAMVASALPNVTNGEGASVLVQKMISHFNGIYEKLESKRFITKRLTLKAVNEGGMGLFHTLFWVFAIETNLFTDVRYDAFNLHPITAGHWAASLLDEGMQAYVDCNISRNLVLLADRDDDKQMVLMKEDQILSTSEQSIVFDNIAYELVTNPSVWAGTKLSEVHRKITGLRNPVGTAGSNENLLVKLTEAVRCCVPLFYLLAKLNQNDDFTFLSDTTASSPIALVNKKSDTLHPLVSYLLPIQVSNVNISLMGSSAFRVVAHLLTKDKPEEVNGKLDSAFKAVSSLARPGDKKAPRKPAQPKELKEPKEPKKPKKPKEEPQEVTRSKLLVKEGEAVVRSSEYLVWKIEEYNELSSRANDLADMANNALAYTSRALKNLDSDKLTAEAKISVVKTGVISAQQNLEAFEKEMQECKETLQESVPKASKEFFGQTARPVEAKVQQGVKSNIRTLIKGEQGIRRAVTIVL